MQIVNNSVIRRPCLYEFLYNYIRNVKREELYYTAINILSNTYCGHRLQVSKDFPKNKLINIMMPYILLYTISTQSFCEVVRKTAQEELYFEMIKFINFN